MICSHLGALHSVKHISKGNVRSIGRMLFELNSTELCSYSVDVFTVKLVSLWKPYREFIVESSLR